MAVATLDSTTLIPMNVSAVGEVNLGDVDDSVYDYDWLMENGIEEAIFKIIEDGVTTTQYYYGSDRSSYVMNEEDVEIPSDVERVITIDLDNGTIEGGTDAINIQRIQRDAYIDSDTGEEKSAVDYYMVTAIFLMEDCSFYQEAYMESGDLSWKFLDSVSTPISKETDDDITIGESKDSITAFTIGDSVYPRGDINLDGKANTADLLYLKKYLLGLIEW